MARTVAVVFGLSIFYLHQDSQLGLLLLFVVQSSNFVVDTRSLYRIGLEHCTT